LIGVFDGGKAGGVDTSTQACGAKVKRAFSVFQLQTTQAQVKPCEMRRPQMAAYIYSLSATVIAAR